MSTFDLRKLKSLKIHEGVEACHKLLLERKRRLRSLCGGDAQGLVKRAGTPLLKADPGAQVTNIPGLGVPPVDELQRLIEARQMPLPADLTRVVPWFASDERVDGDGDIVRQNWNFEEFKDNSPMPFSHEWEQPPVGRVLDWKVVQRADSGYAGPALWLLGLFAGADEWPFADSVYRLVRAGILRGGSVGFFSTRIIEVTDKEERAAIGLGPYGVILDQNTLLEFSPTTIPANPGAVALRARQHGPVGLEKHDLCVVRELLRQDVRDDAEARRRWSAYEEVLIAASKALFPGETFLFHKDLDVPVTADATIAPPVIKRAVPRHETPTDDREWDAGENERRIESGDSLVQIGPRAYAWRDSEGDPTLKGSWKFIHHFVAETGTPGDASTRACSTGIAVLNGGRGGTTIPEADRQGVWNHLAGHLRDAGMEPPELLALSLEDGDMEELKKLVDAIEDLAKAFGEHKSAVEAKLDGLEAGLKALQAKSEAPPPEGEGADGEEDDNLKSLFAKLDNLKSALASDE